MSQNSQNISPSAISSPALPYPYDTIPQTGVSQFVGRDNELETLHQLLQEHDQVVIAGISGIGKTELAIHYAKANLNHYTGGICWLFARSDLGWQIVEFSRSHFPHFTIPDKLTPTTQVRYCWQHWTSLLVSPSQGQNGEVLIIIDNVTDYSQIQPYLPPPSSGFKVLMTTRLQLEQPVQMLSLDVLSPPAALELLASRIGKYRVKDTRGKPFGIDSKRKQSKQKVKANLTPPLLIGEGQGERLTVAQQLCELLGYLPLRIELVGRYLEQERNLSLEKMRSRLERVSKKRLHLQHQHLTHESIIQPEANTDKNLTAQLSIAAAFELSWKRLAQEVQELGCLLSIFALDPIPWTQVESVYGQLYLPGALLGKLLDISPDNSQANIEKLITALLENLKAFRSQLIQLHLLQYTGEETYQLHPLIREFLQEKLESLEQSRNLKETFCQVMIAVAKQIPDSPSRDLIEAVTPAIPHVAEAATALREFFSDEDLIQCWEGLGWFYQSQGFYDLATPWWEQCLSLTQNYLGSDHPNLVTKLHNLAWIYYAQERYPEAEPLSIQALKICEQKLGAEHPLTLATRKNLETLYLALKK
ncbi:tetratricopeptide repeat protein [Allocoleopsis sp.]|uniref:tetratricopeptide repeat protein n=1 Tax=Allocoleopsis sp. TaxID=3088169 RepID=UPI002FD40558